MSDYGIQFADWCEFPPETMVGETVFDSEGNAIGWIVNATVGSDEDEADARALMEAIRDDDGVRYSMDEVLDIMGKDVVATVGNAREPSDAVIERIERFCMDYAQCLMDSTILVKRNYESMDLRAVKRAEVVEDRLIRELAEYIATVGAGTCTMEPDGYYGDEYGIYTCSNCGELWQFDCDGPKENDWKYCPHCRAEIKED